MKRLLLAILATALLGGCDRNDNGRFQVHESIVDISDTNTSGNSGDNQSQSKLFHVRFLIKTDTVTGKAWYLKLALKNGEQMTNEWELLGEGAQPSAEAIRKTLFGDE